MPSPSLTMRFSVPRKWMRELRAAGLSAGELRKDIREEIETEYYPPEMSPAEFVDSRLLGLEASVRRYAVGVARRKRQKWEREGL